ncbi:hypothetical protein C0J52_05680 [Blattella germanica]|nr:hypothetical protein C0J52_05680 [Blattella germanica]
MIKLYLWKQTEDRSEHISLKLSDETYISVWAKEHRLKMKNDNAGKSYEADVEAEGVPAHMFLELPGDIVDQEMVKNWWMCYVDNDKYNCGQVVKKALKSGGIGRVMDNDTSRACAKAHSPFLVYLWVLQCKIDYFITQHVSPNRFCVLL